MKIFLISCCLFTVMDFIIPVAKYGIFWANLMYELKHSMQMRNVKKKNACFFFSFTKWMLDCFVLFLLIVFGISQYLCALTNFEED